MSAPDPGPGDASPLISVIVAVYNTARFLPQCLATLACQTYAALEIIVVDDGSTDDSAAVASAWADADRRFRILRQPNRGLSAARNLGMATAQGAYLSFVDGDDYVVCDMVERLYELARANDVGLACCGLYFDCDGTLVSHPGVHAARNKPLPAAGVFASRDPAALRFFPSAWNKLYRRDLLDGVEFPVSSYFEDHAVFLAALHRSGAFAYTPAPLYAYRRGRPGQITACQDERCLEIFTAIATIQAYRERFLAELTDPAQREAVQDAFTSYVYRLLWERVSALDSGGILRRFVSLALTVCANELSAVRALPSLADAYIPAHFVDLFGPDATVSVLIPAGATPPAHEVARSIAAAASQTVKSLEIVVALAADNPDREVLARLAQGEPRLRFAFLEPGASLGAQRERLVAAARGEWLAFLEIGDDLFPDSYERLLTAAEAQAAQVAAGAVVYRTRASAQERYHSALHSELGGEAWPLDGSREEARLRLAGDLWATPCNKLFRRDLFNDGRVAFGDVGFFDEHVFQVRLALAGPRVGYTAAPVYRISEEPEMRTVWAGPERGRDAIAAAGAAAAILSDNLADPRWRRLFVRLVYRLAWERLHFSGAEGASLQALEADFAALGREHGIGRTEASEARDAYTDEIALHLFAEPEAAAAA